MKVLLAHPGTQHSFHLAAQLHRLQLLSLFYTGIAFGEGRLQKNINKLFPKKYIKKLSNRFIQGVPDDLIRCNIFLEYKALKRLKNAPDTENIIFERNKHFQEAIPDSAIKASDVVIGFDTSGWILAERCKGLGKKFMLDVSIAHPFEKQKIYEQIGKQYPNWALTVKQKPRKLIDLELQEMKIADGIVVASTFSKSTLVKNGVDEKKIFVNPYGTDFNQFRPQTNLNNEIVKFVFVGRVDARKGIPVLLEAWKKIDKKIGRLTLIGPVTAEVKRDISKQYPDIVITGKIPHKDIPDVLAKYDVLVFPTYFEGYALVIPEAMACGLAVITTPSTCAPDIFLNDESGYIVPCGDVGKLIEKMQKLCVNADLLKRMKQSSLKLVKELTWNSYGFRWKKILEQKL